jgi:hypothetical protein
MPVQPCTRGLLDDRMAGCILPRHAVNTIDYSPPVAVMTAANKRQETRLVPDGAVVLTKDAVADIM